MKNKLTWMLFLVLSTASIYSEEVPVAEKKEEPKKEEKLEITGRIQARAVMGQTESGFAQNSDFDAVDFNFRRLRLGAKYQPASWAGGVIDLKVENLVKLASSASPVTTIGGLQEANIWLKPGFLGSVVKIGQFKVPFLREIVKSSANLLTAERTLSEKAIQEFDIGLLLELQPLELIGKDWAKKLDLAFSITNGDGPTSDGIGSKNGEVISTNTATAKLINWRVQVNPFGGLIHDGKEESWKEGMEIFQKNSLLWSIGVAGAHATESEKGLFTGDSFNGYTVDTTFFAYGIYVNGEFTSFSGNAVPTGGYMVYQGTIGYNIPLGSVYLMPLARYNHLDYDSDNSGVVDTGEQENSIWLGVNLFVAEHNLKFQVLYNLVSDGGGASLNKDTLYFQANTNFGKKI